MESTCPALIVSLSLRNTLKISARRYVFSSSFDLENKKFLIAGKRVLPITLPV